MHKLPWRLVLQALSRRIGGEDSTWSPEKEVMQRPTQDPSSSPTVPFGSGLPNDWRHLVTLPKQVGSCKRPIGIASFLDWPRVLGIAFFGGAMEL